MPDRTDDFMGTKDWWNIVLSMPAIETLQHLNDYKAALLEETAGKANYVAAGHMLTRVNTEIKRLNMLISEATWQRAARNILEEDLYDQVVIERRRLAGDFDAPPIRARKEET